MGEQAKLLKLEYIEALNQTKTPSSLNLRSKIKDLDWFFSFNDSLPSNWMEVNILDVTWLVTCGVAKKPDYIEEGIPFLSAQNARPFKTNLNKIKFISEKQFKTLTVGGKPERNDILYTRVGNCGEAAKIPFDFDFAIYVSLTLIKPIHELIDADYLVAFLNSRHGLSQANVGAIGSGLKNLNVNNVRKYKIPLPPLAEQKRIVAKLDDLFASLENTKTRLEKIPTLLKNFKQAILTQAVTGKLTEQWREGKVLEDVDIVNLGSLLEGVKYGTSKKSDYNIDGVPILRIPNIKHGEINVADLKYSILDNKELDKLNLKEGDVLIIRSNGSISIVGKTAVVRKKHISYSFAGYLVRLRPGNGLDGVYLNYALQSNYLRGQIIEKARSTSGVNNINTQEIKELLFPIFSIQEQTEIVRRVESLFAKADAIEAQYQSLKKKVDTLPQAILAKAFKGELVAQNPLDEPASVLLEKIKALREAEVKAKPKRKTVRKKKSASASL
ncbi:restriction endonuclease subunit S [Marinifilum sp. RC60d5]|uniref:restriction endonuclease subunit S n=1 Tax=Marinifilum sp. RC60d5 TaxID=3458414 RepID=UPI004035485C